MSKRSVLHPRSSPKPEKRSATSAVPLNFVLGCSQASLSNFQLACLSAAANLRTQLQVTLDQMIDKLVQAELARFFKEIDRETLKEALATEESAMEWARRMIRGGNDILPHIRKYEDPKKAHRVAADSYSKRNLAKGKCMSCPQPLDPGSVRYCTKHLAMARARASQKKALSSPGSREFLYAGEITPTQGRQPGTLVALATNREQKTRALLAELGIPPESAAVTLSAAKEALLCCMPVRRGQALNQSELFELAAVSNLTTGKKALNELLSEQKIERIGKGIKGDVYRYFLRA